MTALVTKESLTKLLLESDEQTTIQVIGRAVVHLFNRQVEDEKRANTTRIHNGVGFTPADAHSGCLTAKYFLKHKTLLPWQVDRWKKLNARGVPRLAKYHGQLNEVAMQRATAK